MKTSKLILFSAAVLICAIVVNAIAPNLNFHDVLFGAAGSIKAMAIVFSGTKLPQSELKEIQKEIYADWGTFRDKDVAIEEGHKSGTEVYESKVVVNMTAYSSGAISAGADTLTVGRTPVVLTKIQFGDVVDNNVLLDTRFEKTMGAGAFKLVSSEFDNYVLQDITPAICQVMETDVWDGATAAQQTAIAALTPNAAQGSISAGAQTLVAAMTANLFNSIPATILYNYSQSKLTPGAGLGDYKKVLSIAGSVTATNIAAEYLKIWNTIDPKLLTTKDKTSVPVIYAPLADRQFMKAANNSVGVASNQNFTFTGEGLDAAAYYNGIEVRFKPLIGFRVASPPKFIKILMDLASDMNVLETGPMPAGAEQMWYKNVQAIATWVTNQRYIVLYGG